MQSKKNNLVIVKYFADNPLWSKGNYQL